MLNPVRSLSEHWFYGPVLKSKAIYFQVILASVLINLFALASSLYIMTVYDRVIPNNATESQLVDRLLEATTNTTCVYVTHRGAMLKLADHIIVMEQGQIAMAGPRDKVLEKLQGAANG